MSRGVDWLVDSSIYPIILVVSVEIFRGSRKARLKRKKNFQALISSSRSCSISIFVLLKILRPWWNLNLKRATV